MQFPELIVTLTSIVVYHVILATLELTYTYKYDIKTGDKCDYLSYVTLSNAVFNIASCLFVLILICAKFARPTKILSLHNPMVMNIMILITPITITLVSLYYYFKYSHECGNDYPELHYIYLYEVFMAMVKIAGIITLFYLNDFSILDDNGVCVI